jgi:hypothetical protein
VKARSIDERDLRFRPGRDIDPENAGAGCLRFGRCNGELLVEKRIEQGRFPNICSSDNGATSAARGFVRHNANCSVTWRLVEQTFIKRRFGLTLFATRWTLRRMGILSILLSVVAFVCMGIGVLTAWLPVVGSIFAFGSPVLALFGMILGGSAMSQAKRMGEESGAGLVGVILNTLVFLPALLFAFTCGICNACVSTAVMNPTSSNWQMVMKPGTARSLPKKPSRPSDPSDNQSDKPEDPHSPPPLFPPPPLDPGPTKKP